MYIETEKSTNRYNVPIEIAYGERERLYIIHRQKQREFQLRQHKKDNNNNGWCRAPKNQ